MLLCRVENRFFFEKNKKNRQHDLKKEKGDVT